MPQVYIPVKRKVVKPPNEPRGHEAWWADEMKIKAVTVYQATGSLKETAAILGIPVNTIYQWKERAGWWDDVTNELNEADNIKTSNKIKSVVDQALNVLEDRMKNGDLVLDSKTGKVQRVPIKARDLSAISNTMIDRREILRRNTVKATKEQDKASLEGKLDKLAEAFVKFAVGKAQNQLAQAQVIDVELIPEEDNKTTEN